MAKVTFALNGIDTIRARIERAIANAQPEVADALRLFAESIMKESKRRVPVKTGALMNTGKVQEPEVSGSQVTVTLGYGDETVGYALAVHENMSPTVHWTRPGSGPHYLINPVQERQDELPGVVADAIKRSVA